MKFDITPVEVKGGFNFTTMTKHVLESLELAGNESAKAIKVDFYVTVRTWKTEVDFNIEHYNNTARWVISTESKIYKYVNNGTPSHPIAAKNAPRLAFYKTGFRPKSRVGWIGSNKGKSASQDFVRPLEVLHPGIKARGFTKAIKKKWDKEWPRQLARAIRVVT